jgi:Integrase zinc binding domain
LIRDAHQNRLHSGVSDTLVETRQSYWILKARPIIKSVLSQCVPCNKKQRKPLQAPAGSLPEDRCSFAEPFKVTGLDFAGPFYVKDAKEKAWMCLFTCAVTRALHLELVKSMSTPCFLLALNRFISRRGLCQTIYSDNGRTFQRAAKELSNRWKKIDPILGNEMGNKGIQWKFIVEGAPWWGGWWERMVGVVKNLLKKAIGKTSLYSDELETLMIRIEAVVNKRPITYVYNDHQEPRPLCPADFLIGPRPAQLPPYAEEERKPLPATQQELTNRLRFQEKIGEELAARWTEEYL